jgi:GNAT superfamily N-acetyltransferase
MDDRELIAVDEFTSVIDRTVAQIGCAATAKAIRRHPSKRFVAISCHDDIVDWLCPDWILEPHVGRFTWGVQRRRPPIELEIRRVHHSTWALFAPHHYLTGELAVAARCFGAFWRGRIVGFVAWLPFVGRLRDSQQAKRVHRTVVLPDYQGVGIGRAVVDVTSAAWCALGFRTFLGTSHPGEIASRMAHGNWRLTGHGFHSGDRSHMAKSRATNRRTASLEWIGPPLEVSAARELLV